MNLPIIDKVFVINLKRSFLRLEKIKAQFKRMNVKFERIDAINGSEITGDLSRLSSINEYAYILSQKKIIELWAKNREWKNILICDDDILFHRNFHSLFNNLISRIPSDWKILYLGESRNNWSGNKEPDLGGFYQPSANRIIEGSFAVAYSREVLESLLGIIEQSIKNNLIPFDNGILNELVSENINKTFIAYPNLMIADINPKTSLMGRPYNGMNMVRIAPKYKWKLSDYWIK